MSLQRKNAIPWIVFSILWMGLIFFLSAQPGRESGESGKALIYFLKSLGLDPTLLFGAHTGYLIRKTAHFTEYFILTLLIHKGFSLTARGQSLHPNRMKYYCWLLSVFYACTDEFHQAFVPDRVSSPVDVVIDSAGAALAMGFIVFFQWRKNKRANDRENFLQN